MTLFRVSIRLQSATTRRSPTSSPPQPPFAATRTASNSHRQGCGFLSRKSIMFTTAVKALQPRFRPEQSQTITRALFEIVQEHGPLSVAQAWECVQQVGVKDLTSKTQMKTVLRWMKERQKLKQICNHVGPNKQFLYTTWFTKSPTVTQPRSGAVKSSQPKAT